MKKILIISTLLSAALLSQVASATDSITSNIGITNNYIWRGVTQSDDHFSLSGGADYQDNSGLYIGAWAATVDFDDDTNIEYDFYTGYQKQINNVDFDFGYIYYGYQGEEYLDFSEVYIRTSFEKFTLAVSTLLDSDAGGDFTDSTYFEASYSYALPQQITMNIHAGHYSFKEEGNYQDFNMSFSHGDFSIMISTLTGNERLKDTLIAFSYSKSFDL